MEKWVWNFSAFWNLFFIRLFSRTSTGDHEYIDVVNYTSGSSERLIVDIDFRSHFEIARAVESYDQILNSLPVIYVGSLSRLKQFLQIMVEAGKSSLKLNSMPLPPWRSLAYLQAKWQSPCQRMVNPEEEQQLGSRDMLSHEQCIGHLKRLQSVLQSEMESDWFVRPVKGDMIVRKMKSERRRHSLLRAVWRECTDEEFWGESELCSASFELFLVVVGGMV